MTRLRNTIQQRNNCKRISCKTTGIKVGYQNGQNKQVSKNNVAIAVEHRALLVQSGYQREVEIHARQRKKSISGTVKTCTSTHDGDHIYVANALVWLLNNVLQGTTRLRLLQSIYTCAKTLAPHKLFVLVTNAHLFYFSPLPYTSRFI